MTHVCLARLRIAHAAPFVRVLDAYGIARTRADAHPGPDPKTNPKGRTDSPRLFDDCLHYCLPGVPDLYNGRLQMLLEQAAGRPPAGQWQLQPPSAAATSAEPANLTAEGTPGALLARWNFGFGGGQFVQGKPPHIALQLQRGGPPTPLECPTTPPGMPASAAAGVNTAADVSLLGICSDIDPASSFRHGHSGHIPHHHDGHGRRNGSHALAKARRVVSPGLAESAAAARRANKAELLGKGSGPLGKASSKIKAFLEKVGVKSNAKDAKATIKASAKAGAAISKDEWIAAG